MPNSVTKDISLTDSPFPVKSEDELLEDLEFGPYSPQAGKEDSPVSSTINASRVAFEYETPTTTTYQDPNRNPSPDDFSSTETLVFRLEEDRKPHQPRAIYATAHVQRSKPASPCKRVAPQGDDKHHTPPSSPTAQYFYDFINAIEQDSSPDVVKTSGGPPKKRLKWVPVSGHFDASKLRPSAAPLASDSTLPPVVPNGAAVDAVITTDLSANKRYCLVLNKLLLNVNDSYIREYHAANDLPVLTDVKIIEPAARALIYYESQDDWMEARCHDWAIGVVDSIAAEDPLGDHEAYFRVSFAYNTSFLRDILAEVGAALAAYNVSIISAARSNGMGRFITVYTATLEDYLRVLAIAGDIIVAGRTEKELTVLTPRHDLAVTTSTVIIRLYVGGLPSNPCEIKVLALLRTTVKSVGLDPNNVLTFHVHRSKGNMKSSFGFAQVRGSDVASALTNAAVGAKGINLSISLASKSKRKLEQ